MGAQQSQQIWCNELIYAYLFSTGTKTLLLFVIRDHVRAVTPLEPLTKAVEADLEKIWSGISKVHLQPYNQFGLMLHINLSLFSRQSSLHLAYMISSTSCTRRYRIKYSTPTHLLPMLRRSE